MPKDIELLRTTFKEAVTDGDDFVTDVYRHLFVRYPETAELFSDNLERQRHKLIASLGTILERMGDEGVYLDDYLDQLGRKHDGFGVKIKDYPKLEDALILALAEHVSDWSPQMEAAWRKAYNAVADQMVRHNRRVKKKIG